MVARLVLGLGLVAAAAMGRVANGGDGPAGDAFQEGVRLLEQDDRVGKAGHDDFEAEAKRHFDAKEALSRAVADRPDDPTVRAWYALALLRTFEEDEALRTADAAVRLGPRVAFAYRVRGLVHAGRDEHEPALADLDQAVRLGPRDAANLRARGEYLADRHRSDRAFADYAAALQVDPRDAKTYWLRAMLHMEAMNVAPAMKDFDAAILARPDLPALRGARGMLRLVTKDYAGVVDDLGAALKERPDQEMFAMRGFALAQLDRHEEAIRDLDDAIRFDADAKLLMVRGLSYQKLDRLERALQDFDEAVKTKPDAESLAVRGILLAKMGRHEKAADDFGEAIRRDPSNATLRMARGTELLDLGREEAALADYEEAVRLGPDKAEPYFTRGSGRLIAGRAGAGDDFRTVLRLKGWRHEASSTWILAGYAADLLAGRPAEARALLEQALARCDAGKWPYALLRCLHGDFTEANALAAATGERERAEARVYLGIKRITDGGRDAGLRDLREVCDQGKVTGLAGDIARAVLRREGGKAPTLPK